MTMNVYVVEITDLRSDYGMGMPVTKLIKAKTNAEARAKANKKFKGSKGWKVDSVRLVR